MENSENKMVVCIDDFVKMEGVKDFYQQWPEQGVCYEIRKSFRMLNQKTAVLLKSLKNYPVNHPSGLGTIEPSFSMDRFVSVEEYAYIVKSVEDLMSTQ